MSTDTIMSTDTNDDTIMSPKLLWSQYTTNVDEIIVILMRIQELLS